MGLFAFPTLPCHALRKSWKQFCYLGPVRPECQLQPAQEHAPSFAAMGATLHCSRRSKEASTIEKHHLPVIHPWHMLNLQAGTCRPVFRANFLYEPSAVSSKSVSTFPNPSAGGGAEDKRPKKMLDVESIIAQVSGNCAVSDARSAGLYSICGLALRLRDLFKWEKRLPPWEERSSAEVLEWIGEREELWERIGEDDFSPIRLNGRSYDPFDTDSINRVIAAENLFYGAGYAFSLKPTFFLAFIDSCSRIDGFEVFTLGRELARDLLTLPALSQAGQVVIRAESARLFLWDQIFYVKKSGRFALAWALQECGLPDPKPETVRHHLADIFAAARDVYVYHEIGEMRDATFDPALWREIVSSFPHTPVELLARTLKDLLADTNRDGTLPRLIGERKKAAIGFYVAFIDGLAKAIFPTLRPGFSRFVADADWAALAKIVHEQNRSVAAITQTLSSIVREGKARKDPSWAEKEISRQILDPLQSKKGPDLSPKNG
jgi:hypothetical protein